jgi:uncharacterized protein (TIGR02118 family)
MSCRSSSVVAGREEKHVKLILIVRRKKGLSHQEFREYYENNHVPLAVRLIPLFSEYKRNYVDQKEKYTPVHVVNAAAEPDFDVLTEICFDSRADYDKMLLTLADPEIGRLMAEDEEKFIDRNRISMYIVEEYKTAREQLRVG